MFAPVGVTGGMMVDGGTCDNMLVCDLTVDNVPRVGIHLVSETRRCRRAHTTSRRSRRGSST
uniref:hypothetical protein n=1 Tax=Burkholderia ubonensis TaxID=101571 RepID=UPI0030B92BCD